MKKACNMMHCNYHERFPSFPLSWVWRHINVPTGASPFSVLSGNVLHLAGLPSNSSSILFWATNRWHHIPPPPTLVLGNSILKVLLKSWKISNSLSLSQFALKRALLLSTILFWHSTADHGLGFLALLRGANGNGWNVSLVLYIWNRKGGGGGDNVW